MTLKRRDLRSSPFSLLVINITVTTGVCNAIGRMQEISSLTHQNPSRRVLRAQLRGKGTFRTKADVFKEVPGL